LEANGGSSAQMAHVAEDKTWQKNAPSQIVLDSIFAALAAVLIGFSVQLPGTWHKFLELVSSLLAFVLFARSAEGTTTALDERDVRQYVYYLLWYNLAVILLIIGLGLLLYSYFSTHFLSFLHRYYFTFSMDQLQRSIAVIFIIFFGFLLPYSWIRDCLWLILVKKGTFSTYLAELEDAVDPEPAPSLLCKFFYRYIRKL
jgi:hypothetical protein